MKKYLNHWRYGQRLWSAIMIAAALSLSACSNVQSIKLQPKTSYQQSSIGHGKAIAVNVLDARANQYVADINLGDGVKRKLLLSNDISTVVRNSVYKALRVNNFKPVGPGRANTTLKIRISGLNYDLDPGTLKATVNANSTIEAESNNKGASYDKVYRGKSTYSTYWWTQKDDTRTINNALSTSLNKLANDKQLMRFLAK